MSNINKLTNPTLGSQETKASDSYRSPYLRDDENNRLIEHVKKGKSEVIILNCDFRFLL